MRINNISTIANLFINSDYSKMFGKRKGSLPMSDIFKMFQFNSPIQ